MAATAFNSAVTHGRSVEMRAVDSYLDRLEESAHHLVVLGEVGIGRTTLVEYARDAATARGFAVLSATAVGSEVDVGFAALTDLVECIPARLIKDLPSPQRRAIEAAVVRADPDPEAVDSLGVGMGFLSALRALAQDRPVLLVVDDMPSVDPSSLRVLSFAIRRLEAERAGLLCAVRTQLRGSSARLPTDDANPARVGRLQVTGLDLESTALLLRDCATPVIDRSMVRLMHRSSGGNPMFLLRLAEEVARKGAPPPVDPTLPIPESLHRLAESQLAEVPQSWRSVLLLSALAPDATVDVLTRAADDADAVGPVLESAAGAGIIELEGARVAYRHPLIRSVVAEQASTEARRSAHRRLAEVVPRPEERAVHRALSTPEPDEAVAAELEAAASAALRKGACEAAAQLAELAVNLTPPGLEQEARRRTLAAADCLFAAGDPQLARALTEKVIATLDAGPLRAAAVVQSSRYAMFTGVPFDAICTRLHDTIEEAGDDTSTVLAIRRSLAFLTSQRGQIRNSRSQGVEILNLAQSTGNAPMIAFAASGLAFVEYLCGEGIRWDLISIVRKAVDEPIDVPTELSPTFALANLFRLAGRFEEARPLLAEELRRAEDRGDETSVAVVLFQLSEIAIWTGDWDRAEVLAASALRNARWSASDPVEGLACCAVGAVRAHRGDVAEARTMAARAHEIASRTDFRLLSALAAHLDGFVDLSIGEFTNASLRLEPWATPWGDRTMLHSGARAVPDAIEAAVRAGYLARAREVARAFAEHAPAIGRWAEAAAARCRALVLSADGDQLAATEALHRALAIHEELQMPFDRARTLLVAGEVHRRMRRKADARDAFQTALETFETLGAPLWTARARAEVARVGIRVPRTEVGLSEAQEQMAELVLLGHTNKEIAARMSMSVSAVEKHLSSAYRALGVRSRTQFVGKMAGLPSP